MKNHTCVFLLLLFVFAIGSECSNLQSQNMHREELEGTLSKSAYDLLQKVKKDKPEHLNIGAALKKIGNMMDNLLKEQKLHSKIFGETKKQVKEEVAFRKKEIKNALAAYKEAFEAQITFEQSKKHLAELADHLKSRFTTLKGILEEIKKAKTQVDLNTAVEESDNFFGNFLAELKGTIKTSTVCKVVSFLQVNKTTKNSSNSPKVSSKGKSNSTTKKNGKKNGQSNSTPEKNGKKNGQPTSTKKVTKTNKSNPESTKKTNKNKNSTSKKENKSVKSKKSSKKISKNTKKSNKKSGKITKKVSSAKQNKKTKKNITKSEETVQDAMKNQKAQAQKTLEDIKLLKKKISKIISDLKNLKNEKVISSKNLMSIITNAIKLIVDFQQNLEKHKTFLSVNALKMKRIADQANAKNLRNSRLLKSALKLGESYRKEFSDATKNRLEEVETIKEILNVLKKRLATVPKDISKKILSLELLLKKYVNNSKFKAYKKYIRTSKKDSLHGKSLANKKSLK